MSLLLNVSFTLFLFISNLPYPFSGKEDRKAQLAAQYMQRLASMRLQNPSNLAGTMYAPTPGGYFVSSGLPPRPFMAGMPGQIRNPTPSWSNVAGQYPNMQNLMMPPQYGQMQQQQRSRPMRARFQSGQRPNRVPMQGQPGGAPTMPVSFRSFLRHDLTFIF